MRCPICDQKPMNCDCTPEERRQYAEIGDLEDKIASLRPTDAERQAIEKAAAAYESRAEQRVGLENDGPDQCAEIAAVLRGLLARCALGSGDGGPN